MSLVETKRTTTYKILCDCGGRIFIPKNEFDKNNVLTCTNNSHTFYPSDKVSYTLERPVFPKCSKCGAKHKIIFDTNNLEITVERID